MISVIIPVYNRQELVKETLDSVLAQTYSDWECIVVDDGSTDNSWNVLQEYAQKDTRIKPFQRNREPKGAPTCRNMGIDLSKGEYLMFLDSDDLLAPWALAERNDLITKLKADVILSSGANFDKLKKEIEGFRVSYGRNNIFEEFINLRFPFQTSSPTWKKRFLEENRINWDERYSKLQDIEYHINCFYYEPTFKWGSKIPDFFVRQAENHIRISNQESYKIIENYYRIINWLDQRTLMTSLILKKWQKEIIKKVERLPRTEIKKVLALKETDKCLNYNQRIYLKLYLYLSNIYGLRGIIYRAKPLFIGKSIQIFPKNLFVIEDDIQSALHRMWPDFFR